MESGMKWITLVSIPNGMEFYFFCSTAGVKMRFVSIPNGMEFYSIAVKLLFPWDSFNSQRDGILQMTADLAFALGGSFNSQRDGILHAGRLA